MITLLQAAAGQQPSMWPTIIMMVALFAIVYFFMIRPQQQKQKQIQNFRNALTVGQDVVTIGGLHGTIRHIDEGKQTVTLRVANGVEVVFDKSAIVPNGVQAVQQ
ncbi:MAG: preprotein translocase subunit YajC [Bacteroidales bacterium]|nr:preprotein translocase subunit YajC [Bacteroidales bacterium]